MTEKDDFNHNNSNPLRNGIILNLDQRMDEILRGIGLITGEVKALREEGERHSKALRTMERKQTSAIRKINRRIDSHIEDHRTKVELMGVSTFLKHLARTYKAMFWIVLTLILAGNIALALERILFYMSN